MTSTAWQKIVAFYDTHYKKLAIIPWALIIFAIVQLAYQYNTTGDFINRGVSLQGGSTITVLQPADALQLQKELSGQFPKLEIAVRSTSQSGKQLGVIIETSAQEKEDVGALLSFLSNTLSVPKDQISVEVVGAALSKSFFRQLFTAVVFAFVLMAIVVLIYFRKLVPSIAVIVAAVSDIIVTLAIFNLTGEKLSAAGIVAFLMLIGYSVDTDMLLNTRVLRREEGTNLDRIHSSIKTGFTMLMTTLIAVLIALLLVQSEVIKQIMLIIFIGLLVDMVMTWIQNVWILRIYLEHKEKKRHGQT